MIRSTWRSGVVSMAPGAMGTLPRDFYRQFGVIVVIELGIVLDR